MKKRKRSATSPAETELTAPPRLTTGVPGLDFILGGGLIAGRLYLIKGPPGVGKTVLASQLCFERARAGDRCVYATLMTESHGTLLENLRTLSFFDPSLVPGQVAFVSAYQSLEEGGHDAVNKLLRATIHKQGAKLLIVDGLAVPGDSGTVDVRRFLRELATSCSLLGCTAVCTTPDEDTSCTWMPEAKNAADGLIELSRVASELRTARVLEVFKLRGSSHVDGKHTYQIGRRGVIVYPRTEARFEHTEAAPAPRKLRPFGNAELDGMMHGGLVDASSTVLLGAPGSGKTVLGLHFLAAGAKRRERGLYFGFYESPPRLAAKAEGIGLPFGRFVTEGLIETVWQPAVELSIDALAERLLDAVRRAGVQRLFLDGIDGFRIAALFPDRLTRFFVALTNELRALGVTTVLTDEIPIMGDPERRTHDSLFGVFENILLLRYVELRSQLHRLVSIVKMRESEYDSSIREFRISRKGIDVASTFESAEAILSGQARLTAAAPAPAQPPKAKQRR